MRQKRRGAAQGAQRGRGSTARGAYHGTARGAAHGAAGEVARGTTHGTIRGSARGTTRGATRGATRGSSRGTTRGTARGTARGTTRGTAHRTAHGTARGIARRTARRIAHWAARGSSKSKQIVIELLPPSDDSKHVWIMFLLEIIAHIYMLQNSIIFAYIIIIALFWMTQAVCTLVQLCKLFLQLVIDQIVNSNARCVIERYLELERNTHGKLEMQILVNV